MKTMQTVRMIQKMDETFMEGRKQNFACECGKRYSTFPALYLHFKRVHKIKISTKVTQEPCYITETNSNRTFTYLCSQNLRKQRSLQECSTKFCGNDDLLHKILNQFISEQRYSLKNSVSARKLCEQLKRFIVSSKISTFTENGFRLVQDLPLHFNNFMAQRPRQLEKEDLYIKDCEILMNLAKWLNFKSYSFYILQPLYLKQNQIQN